MAGTEDVPGEEAEVVEGTAVAKAGAAEAEKPAGRKRRRTATIKTIADMRHPMAELLQSPTVRAIGQLQAAADRYARLIGPSASARALMEQITASNVFAENTRLKLLGELDSGKGLTALFDSIDRLQSSQRGTELAFTSALAELTKSGSAIAWRNSLLAQHYVDFGIKPALGLVDGVLVGKLAGVSEQTRMLTSWAAHYEALPNLISPLGAEAVAAWRGQVLGLPEAPSSLDLRRSISSGTAVLGLTGADVLTSEDLDSGLREEAVEQVEHEVLQPYEQGRLDTLRDLHAALARIDPKLAEPLNGAWHDLVHRGPAAAEKAANCAVEVIHRVLRTAAPADAVLAWHAETKRSIKEWEGLTPGKDNPPHSLRVRYLMRDRQDLAKVLDAEIEALGALQARTRKRLEAVKHESVSNLATVKALVVATESFLISLLLDE